MMTGVNSRIRFPLVIETIALFLIPFEELLTLPFGSVLRILNLINIVYILITYRRISLDLEKKSPIPYLFLFLAYVILSGIWCFNRGLFLDRLVTYGMYTLLLILLRTLEPNENEKKWMVTGLFWGGVLASILLLFGTGLTLDLGGGRETIAIAGRKVDANVLSISMVMSFIIAFYNVLFNKNLNFIRKIGCFIVLFLIFMGILAAGSRGAMVCTIISAGIMVMGIKYDKNKILKRLFLVIICCLVLLFIYYRVILEIKIGSRFTIDNLLGLGSLGTANRERIWSVALKKFLENPVVGYGNGSSPYVIQTEYRFYGTHNSYIMVLLEFGIIGFWIVLTWIKKLYIICRNLESKLYKYLLIGLLILVLFVEGFSTKIFWGTMVLLHLCSICENSGVQKLAK